MEGMYVPFWLYDYQAKGHYDGECTKIRTWMAGDRQFTETSVYHVVREMDVSFDKVPVDASNAMPDETMDLMEPYDYKALESFRAEYMSGFSAERYNQTADYLEYRAKTKAFQDAETMLHDSVTGYTDKKTMKDNVDLNCAEQNYALMPVWIYNYKYKGQDYRFHVNGQTGKIVGKVPIVQGKVIGYGATVFGIIFSIAMMARFLML